MSGGKHHSTNNGKVAERSKAPGSGTPELADPPGFPGLSNGARVRISPLSATFCRFCVRCRCGAGVMPAWCRRAALHADPLIFDPPSRRPQSCGLVASADVDSRAGYAEQSCAAAVACRFWSGLGSVFRGRLERGVAGVQVQMQMQMGGQCRAWLLICHRGGWMQEPTQWCGAVWCGVVWRAGTRTASETPEIPSALRSAEFG